MKKLFSIISFILISSIIHAQTKKIIVFDHDTKDPVAGANIKIENGFLTSNTDGSFIIKDEIRYIEISASGYKKTSFTLSEKTFSVSLEKLVNNLNEVVVTANRDIVKRVEAPIAIASISAKTISDTKATTIDQLINKVSGVYMVNLGNEQHSMGIRQPMSTRAVFMYLEDGVPIRTSGVFNHNALMELNMAAVKNIELIKGPSSSLYGGEAIGGAVNFITQTGTAIPTAKISLQGNDIGYRRADIQTGFIKGKLKANISGYYAGRNNGFLPYSDFNKRIITARADYSFTPKTILENSFTWMNYYSDMNGGVDSIQYTRKTFTSQHTFTWRKAITSRFRSTLNHEWNEKSKSSITAVLRSNTLDMNASFRIRDDYRKQGTVFVGKKDLAHGEISVNSFNSYVLIAQHRQKFNWLNTTIVGGGTIDFSPNTQKANYIKVNKDTLLNQYISYVDRPDSLLTNYKNDIANYAGFLNLEFSPFKHLRIVTAIRYDVFRFNFDNYLKPSAFSGSPDTVNTFKSFSPKIGFTYQLGHNRGFYGNYSRGFVPPQVSELYRGVSVPNLSPSIYDNYEVGGWSEIIKGKLSFDFSLYRLIGNNTIISVRFDDGSFGNANAGKTLSNGIEFGLNATVAKTLQLRFSGAYSKHEFVQYVERGVKFNGNEINSAPRFVSNAELTWRPNTIKGLRVLAEWQKMSRYFMDQANLFEYNGFNVFNLRIGYSFNNAQTKWLRGTDFWINAINLFNAYYAVNSSRSTAGRSYNLGEPRNINVGMTYDFGSIFNK